MIEYLAAGVSTLGLLLNAHIWYKFGKIEEGLETLRSQFASVTYTAIGGKSNDRRKQTRKSMD